MREYHLITTGKIKAKNAEFKAQRVLNQEQAVLFKFAFHSPNKMPDFTKSKSDHKPKVIEGAQGANLLRAHLNQLFYESEKGKR